MYKFQRGLRSLPRSTIVVGVLGGLLHASASYGQFIPGRGSTLRDSGAVGNVGVTGVWRNNQYLGVGGGGSFRGGTPTSGNFVETGANLQPFLTGRTGWTPSPLLTRWGGQGAVSWGGFTDAGWNGAIIAPPSTYRFARGFAYPPATGADRFTTVGDRLPVPRTQKDEFLFHRMLTTNKLGHTAPTRTPLEGWRIRDTLSQQSLDHRPPVENLLEDSSSRRSYSDMLETRIAAQRTQMVAQAWGFFHDGEYRRAIYRFEAAELVDRRDPEAAIGTIIAALADQTGELAYTILARVVNGGERVFDVDIDLRNQHADPAFITSIVESVSRLARQNPDNPQLSAMSAFLLWFSGQRDEALRVADRIREEHRGSAYASLATMLRGKSKPVLEPVGPARGSETFPAVAGP